MKKALFTSILLAILSFCYSQENKAVFLHHSTGGGVFSEGDVSSWIDDFNSGNSTDYAITERAYPNSPWPWENYPYDYWKLWIGGECNNDKAGIECIESIASNYELVIYKHCYPGAGIQADGGSPDLNSSTKSLENYKLQYRALRDMMDGMPDTKFMIWTLVPLHRLATNADNAARAHEFVEWVKYDFLTEDDKEHSNIYIFDFFGAVAELNESPENGQQYCLKYDFEKSHDNNDSHPNLAANKYVGPLFARAVVNALSGEVATTVGIGNSPKDELSIFPQPVNDYLTFELANDFQDKFVQIISITGTVVYEKLLQRGKKTINTSNFQKGMYFIKIKQGQNTFLERFIKQ